MHAYKWIGQHVPWVPSGYAGFRTKSVHVGEGGPGAHVSMDQRQSWEHVSEAVMDQRRLSKTFRTLEYPERDRMYLV